MPPFAEVFSASEMQSRYQLLVTADLFGAPT
jgi:hypothetical protein